MQQPTLFCHDGTTIYYPTGPGRVHMIDISALYDCDGSDEDFSDSTSRGDVSDLGGDVVTMPFDILGSNTVGNNICPGYTPCGWPPVHQEQDGGVEPMVDLMATGDDFADCLEMWADWCDRDAACLDSLDGPAPDEEATGILARLRALLGKTPYTWETLAKVVAEIRSPSEEVASCL